jgi:hypothetical protein
MNDDEIARRKRLTFAQAEGAEPLPTQLKRTEVSKELRAVLWKFIHDQIDESAEYDGFRHQVDKPWSNILEQLHVYHYHRLVSRGFSLRLKDALESVESVFAAGDYVAIYGWLQFVLSIYHPQSFVEEIEQRLRYCRSPYRVVDNEVLCPLGSDEEAKAIEKAFSDLRSSGLSGAREHLKKASGELTAGHFAASVRESISAVESIVRVLEPDGDFGKALAKLEAKTNIHGALKQGFTKIYAFTSDEQGIRHALLEKGAPDVDEADALFMIGACSAFVSYLINKARSVGLLK